MGDNISRAAAISALKGLPTWWADEGGYYGGAQPPMTALLEPNDAVSAIKNLPKIVDEIQNRWIPCSHDLPKNHDEVIVSIKDERGDTPYEYTTSGWYTGNHWIVDNEFCYDVVAWMPPLEPYKKE